MNLWPLFFNCLAFAFAGEHLGIFTHESNTAFLIFSLLMAAALDHLRNSPSDNQATKSALWPWLLMFIGLFALPLTQGLRFFAIALWFLGLGFHATLKQNPSRMRFSLALGSCLLGLYHYLYHHSLLVWQSIQKLSITLSSSLGSMIDYPLDLRPTFSGIHLLMMAFLLCIAFWKCSLLKRKRDLAVICGASLFCFLIYLQFFALLPFGFSKNAEGEYQGWHQMIHNLHQCFYPNHMSVPLFLLLMVPLAFYNHILKQEKATSTQEAKTPFKILPAAFASLAVIFLLTQTNAWPGETPRRVALYEKGFLNWIAPAPNRFGPGSVGMFGNLPRFFDAMGWQSEKIDSINAETLEGFDVLVIINQDKPLADESITDIENFVQTGGGLWIMGDHTWEKNDHHMVINQPLAQSNIKFLFDSADFIVGGWLHSCQFWPHPIVNGLSDHYNQASSVVGASLEVKYPAIPLVIGRYGYSDPGEMSDPKRGFLGNLDYDPGEPLGDTVLVAAEKVGEGQVIVFGDTSALANGLMTSSWPFVSRAFAWCANPDGQAAVSFWREGLALLLILWLFGNLNQAFRFPTASLAIVPLMWVSFGSVMQCWATVEPPLLRHNANDEDAFPLAIVDHSHIGNYSLEGWNDNGISSVVINLMRQGFFTINFKEFSSKQLHEADVFVSVAPTQPYSDDEMDHLFSFMEKGGTMILAVGWEEQAASIPLLERAGLELVNQPLGRNGAEVPGLDFSPYFWKAWPVRGGETIATIWDQPVVVRKNFGQGQLIMIGDSSFLREKNLENDKQPVMPNIHFLNYLMTGKVTSS